MVCLKIASVYMHLNICKAMKIIVEADFHREMGHMPHPLQAFRLVKNVRLKRVKVYIDTMFTSEQREGHEPMYSFILPAEYIWV